MSGGRYDAIVIGGGHNGLVCAAYLARAGRRTLVLEASKRLGGAAVTREFASDFKVSACAHLLYGLDARVESDLNLAGHGLTSAVPNLPTFALDPAGGGISFGDGVTGKVPPGDSAVYPVFRERLLRFAGLLRRIMEQTPPRLGSGDWEDRRTLLGHGWALRQLGPDDLREFLRIAGSNIYDLTDDSFEDPLIKAALCLDATLGTHAGPRSPGSVFTLLHRWSGQAGGVAGALALPAGGMGSVTAALAAAAEAAGAELRVASPVARVLVQGDRARGVELEDGSRIEAAAVASSADPRRSFLDLVGARHLDSGFAHRIAKLRMRGTTAKLHLALESLPNFNGLEPEALAGRLLIAPDPNYVERAFNPAKYGEYSPNPVFEIVLPSLHDQSLAPAGKHVLSAVVQYAPYALKAGWEKARDGFADRLVDLLTGYAPGLKRQILAREVLTPVDLEREFRLTGGHWHQGEIAFDQFLMLRPVPGAAQYATPLAGFYLCGAGSHPGGGIMGSAGRLAANRILSGA